MAGGARKFSSSAWQPKEGAAKKLGWMLSCNFEGPRARARLPAHVRRGASGPAALPRCAGPPSCPSHQADGCTVEHLASERWNLHGHWRTVGAFSRTWILEPDWSVRFQERPKGRPVFVRESGERKRPITRSAELDHLGESADWHRESPHPSSASRPSFNRIR